MLPFQNILKITLQLKYADMKKIDQENVMYSQDLFFPHGFGTYLIMWLPNFEM